jgi:voltage-gated potassium channel
VNLKSVVERSDTKAGKAFDLTIQALIVLSVVSFSIETLPDLSVHARQILRYIEIFTVGVFTVEYLLRVVVADRKMEYVISWWGFVDLFAILPFYVTTGLDLRSIRVLRILRLFRILKLVRYNAAVQRYHLAFKLAREEILLFFAAALIVIYLSSAGIYYFENPAQPEQFSSIFDSLWWSVATLTSVGYGDIYPVTAGGKIFTSIVLLVGLGIVAVPAGLMASALSRARELQKQGSVPKA